jgi:hypothetical protein
MCEDPGFVKQVEDYVRKHDEIMASNLECVLRRELSSASQQMMTQTRMSSIEAITGWFVDRVVHHAVRDPTNARMNRRFLRVDYSAPEVIYSRDSATSTYLDSPGDGPVRETPVRPTRFSDTLEVRLCAARNAGWEDADRCSSGRAPLYHPHDEFTC